ncbi:exported protein of unknown function [Pararobbsia alpina]|uniref:beta-propeller fold lactonase family protein n=1 Tax=Pararobbsia alpina TaxID=621374 RepID=UPI0039A4CCD8
MKRSTRWRWGCWMLGGACVLAGCGGDNTGAAPPTGHAASVGGAAQGVQVVPTASADVQQDAPEGPHVGGTVTGLDKDTSLKLFNNRSELLTVSKNGTFHFASEASTDAPFDVTVAVHPRGQHCTVSDGVGVVGGATAASDIKVECVARTQFAIVRDNTSEIHSYRLDPHNGVAHYVAANGQPWTLIRRLTLSRDGSRGYVIRRGGDYGTDANNAKWIRPIGTFTIDLKSGALGKIDDLNWTSRSGRALDFSLNPVNSTLSVIQFGYAYADIKVNSSAAIVERPHMFLGVTGSPSPSPSLDRDKCWARDSRGVSYMPTGDVVGNMRSVAQGRLHYTLGCNALSGLYTLRGYTHDYVTGTYRQFDIGGDVLDTMRSPESFDINPQETYLYAVDSQGSGLELGAFRIDLSSGRLKLVQRIRLSDRPTGVFVNHDGSAVYVLHVGNEKISAFTVDASTGALSSVKGSPFKVGKMPTGFVIDASETFAYVSEIGDAALGVYRINPETKAIERAGMTPYLGIAEFVLTP